MMKQHVEEYKGFNLFMVSHYDDDAPKVRVMSNDEFIGDYRTMQKAKQAVDRRAQRKRNFKKFQTLWGRYGGSHRIVVNVNSVSKCGNYLNISWRDRYGAVRKEQVRWRDVKDQFRPLTDENLRLLEDAKTLDKKATEIKDEATKLRKSVTRYSPEELSTIMSQEPPDDHKY